MLLEAAPAAKRIAGVAGFSLELGTATLIAAAPANEAVVDF
jgi:hypothetical protein